MGQGSVNKLLDDIDNFAILVMYGGLQWHLTGKRMRGASKAWIINAERHFHHVEQTFAHLPAFDEGSGGLGGAHLNGGIVIGGTNDEIGLGDDAALEPGDGQ